MISKKEKVISVAYIQEVVAKYFGIDVKDLKSSKKSNDIVFPRQIAMYLCRVIANSSFPKIGDEFGKRDHTTVMHAYKKIDKSDYLNALPILKRAYIEDPFNVEILLELATIYSKMNHIGDAVWCDEDDARIQLLTV